MWAGTSISNGENGLRRARSNIDLGIRLEEEGYQGFGVGILTWSWNVGRLNFAGHFFTMVMIEKIASNFR